MIKQELQLLQTSCKKNSVAPCSYAVLIKFPFHHSTSFGLAVPKINPLPDLPDPYHLQKFPCAIGRGDFVRVAVRPHHPVPRRFSAKQELS